MTTRELTKEEKSFMEKQIARMDFETKGATYMIKYCDLMLDEGLQVNFDRQRKEFEAQKTEAVNAIELNKNTIVELNKQIENGVEVKEVVDEDAE